MLWEVIIIDSRTDLVFLQRFLTAQLCLDTVLRPRVHPFEEAVCENFHPMHDNVRPNTARIVPDGQQGN